MLSARYFNSSFVIGPPLTKIKTTNEIKKIIMGHKKILAEFNKLV